MNEEPGFVAGVLRDLAASTAAILAAWGALGGATNALTTRMRLRDAIRHILLGGIIAAGMGSFSMALVALVLFPIVSFETTVVRPELYFAMLQRPVAWVAVAVVAAGVWALVTGLRGRREDRAFA